MSIIGMRTKMSKYLKWLVLAIAASFAVGFIAMTIGPGRQGLNPVKKETGVLAKVNGEKLSWQDYQDMLAQKKAEYDNRNVTVTPVMEIQDRGQIFDDMVTETMWVQAARKEGIKVSRGELKKKIDEYADMQMKSLREQLLQGKRKKTDAVFEAEIAKTWKGMNIKKKRAEIRAYFESLSDKVRSSLMMEKLYKKIDASVPVSDRAVEESFDSASISQITVASTGKRSDEQARKRADEIVAKLKKGGDFAAVAKESSDDMYAQFGGNRGPVQRMTVEPELKDVAFKLDSGQVSDPIKTRDGYVILKSAGVMHNVPPDFNDPKRKREYKDSYTQQARQSARSAYETKLRKGMKLEVLDPELKAYTAFKDTSQKIMALDEAGRKQAVEGVIKLYQDAAAAAGDQPDAQARCYIQMATLYGIVKSSPMFGLTKAEQEKYGKLTKDALFSALDNTEDVGVRMALARLLVDEKDYAGALEHLQVASENAYEEQQTHEQIRDMYKQMNRADLAAAEQKWIDDYKKAQAESGEGAVRSQPVRVPAGGQ